MNNTIDKDYSPFDHGTQTRQVGDKFYRPNGATKIEMVMCGHCEKKITPNLIASFGADHHDPEEMSCRDCFNGIISRAEMLNAN